jgi:hypothetical protein
MRIGDFELALVRDDNLQPLPQVLSGDGKHCAAAVPGQAFRVGFTARKVPHNIFYKVCDQLKGQFLTGMGSILSCYTVPRWGLRMTQPVSFPFSVFQVGLRIDGRDVGYSKIIEPRHVGRPTYFEGFLTQSGPPAGAARRFLQE